MKKRVLSFVLSFVLILSLTAAASAEELHADEMDKIIDETGQLLNDNSAELNSEAYPNFEKEYNVDLRANIVLEISEERDCAQTAEFFYDTFGYGAEGTGDGLLLLMYINFDGSDVSLNDYAVYAGGVHKDVLTEFASVLESTLSGIIYLDGDLDTDIENISEVLDAMYNFSAAGFLTGAVSFEPELPEEAFQGNYVLDTTGLLGSSAEEIDDICAASAELGCGVYIIFVNNYKTELAGSDVEEAAKSLYVDMDLGTGPDRDGIILLVSMAGRDMALFSHGYMGNAVKSEEVYDSMMDNLRFYFGDDDWEAGSLAFAREAYEAVAPVAEWEAEHPDEPVSDYRPPVPAQYRALGIAACLIIAFLISMLILHILRNQLLSVHTGREADAYISDGGLRIHSQYDHYVRTSESRVLIESNSSSSGSSHSSSGGGFSGGSSKF